MAKVIEEIEDNKLTDKTRDKIFSLLINKINKNAVKHGYTTVDKPVIGKASEMAKLLLPRIPTGNVLLDFYTGGGLKRGTSSLWYGGKGIGKSSQAIITAGEVAKLGGHTLWVQAEEGDIFELLKLHGVPEESVYIVNAQGTAEACFDIIETVLKQNKDTPGFVDLIVVDSLAGLSPKLVTDKTDKDGRDDATQSPGAVAKAFAEWYRDLHSTKLVDSAHLMLISQIRNTFDKYHPEIFVGGKAMEHAPRLLVQVARGPNGAYVVKNGKVKYNIGHQIRLDLVKDGVSHINQGRQFLYDVYYGIAGRKRGIDNESALQVLLTDETNAFEKGGAWFKTNEDLLSLLPEDKKEQYVKFQGKDNIKKALTTDPDFYEAAKKFLETAESVNSGDAEEIEETEE